MLYLVGMPIGNIRDTSLRAIETLSSSDIVLTEDTRSFIPFLQKAQDMLGIKPQVDGPKIIPYHDQNEFIKLPDVLDWLKDGKKVSLVSEAGMPVVSDPGSLLVTKARKKNIPIDVIPGPTAFATVASLEGAQENIYFGGFLPKKYSDIKRVLTSLQGLPRDTTIIWYESPRRVHKSIEHIQKYFPHGTLSVYKDLTKEHYKVYAAQAISELEDVKGELVIALRI